MADSDKDGLTDVFERRIGTNPFDKDSDNDGLTDAAERKLGTKPMNHDSDGDGFMDGSEYAQGKSPTHADPPNQYADRWGRRDQPFKATADDPDADGLDEMQERMQKTDPNDPDTDGDGLGDGFEFIAHRDPLKPEPLLPSNSGAPKSASAAPPASSGVATASTATSPANALMDTGDQTRDAFLNAARAQIGDLYRFGAEADLDDANPTAFDSSELVQWAAKQAGVDLPDGSWNQYRTLHEQGANISVEHALQTPGALVFGFSSDPLDSADRPARAYVGISLGDGRVLDVSERAGEVREMGPGNFYTHAAVVPQFTEQLPTGPDSPALYDMLHPSSPLQRDTDGDGMLDVDESVVERNPFDPNDGDQPITRPSQVDPTLPNRADDAAPASGSEAPERAPSEEPPVTSEEPAAGMYEEPVTFDDPAPVTDGYGSGSEEYAAIEDTPVESYAADEFATEV